MCEHRQTRLGCMGWKWKQCRLLGKKKKKIPEGKWVFIVDLNKRLTGEEKREKQFLPRIELMATAAREGPGSQVCRSIRRNKKYDHCFTWNPGGHIGLRWKMECTKSPRF